MAERLRQERIGTVLVLTMDNPPVNALAHPLRAALSEALTSAASDDGIHGILLRAEGRAFSAGADIAEFGQPPRAPLLTDLCNQIEASPKPVIAALQGVALGGGMELALAAHHRVAEAGARMGLPEVALGLLPGAGGTQRLPRLIGATEALRLILSGKPVTAAEALALGLLDQVVEGAEALQAAALALAAAAPAPPRPTRARTDGLRDAVAYQAAITAARRKLGPAPLPAPPRIIDCVEAAHLLPFDQGLAFERAAFTDLVSSPESAALRHAFFAERRAETVPPALAAVPPQPIGHIGLWSLGPMGAGLALRALRAGLRLTSAEADRTALVAALEPLAALIEAEVAAGRLTPEARDADWARLTPAVGSGPLAGLDAVIGADGWPDLHPQAVLLVPGGDGLHHPGLHLAAKAALAELAAGPGVAPRTLATALALLRRLGLRAVLTGPGPGIGASVLRAGQAAADWLMARGQATGGLGAYGLSAPTASDATAATIDRCLGAMAAEGFRLLAQGTARRPADIDAVLIGAHGFARHHGGPMFQAGRRGLLVLRRDLRIWAEEDALWSPPALLDDLIRDGVTLDALNRA